ncbi:MAG: hypothetical protein K2P46_01295, partial [Alistipes sp.]|jgi:hypothetical protein|nr:hypothetical protein [Alistipes sp.]
VKGSVYKTFFGQLTQSAIPAAAPKMIRNKASGKTARKRQQEVSDILNATKNPQKKLEIIDSSSLHSSE